MLADKNASKTISILGCGWFGLALARQLVEKGYRVKGSTTSPEKLNLLAAEDLDPFLISFSTTEVVSDPAFFDTDVLFICIPPKRKSNELEDYPEKITAILNAAKDRAKAIILISSTSVYGDDNQIVNENSILRPDTDSGKQLIEAEKRFQSLRPNGATIIRFGGLIGPNRDPGRFFAGKTDIPNGLAPVNLIEQKDAVGIAIRIIERSAFGQIYNACAPQHPTRMEFYTAAASASGLALPTFIAEKKQWKVVESVHVSPILGYEFLHKIQ